MELQIYSDDALEIIKLGEMTQEETIEYYKKHNKDDISTIKAIIGAYAAELIIAADEADVKLDLSYDTIKNIPEAVAALYNKQCAAGFVDSRNKDVTCRSFAAYMDLLIINNYHDVSIDVRRYPDKKQARPEVWADYLALVLDGKKNSDMLPFICKGASLTPNEMTIDIAPLTEGYKKLTGSKLTDEGLTSIKLSKLELAPEKKLELGPEKKLIL